MITTLTQEQEAKIDVYYKEGLEVGHNTSPLNREEALTSIKEIIEFTGLTMPKNFVFLDSPLACQKAYIQMQKEQGVKNPSMDTDYFSPWRWGYISYYQFYAYIRNELFPERREEFPLLDKVLKWNNTVHYFQLNGGTAFISERPVHIKKNSLGLHCENDAALKYKDGYGVYALNGVLLEEEIILTPADQLDLKKHLLQERNAEKRREVFRKVGSENVVNKLGGKLLDQWNMILSGDAIRATFGEDTRVYPYELYEVDLGNGNKHPFLKMINPSIDAEPFEAVPKGVKTVQEALAFRNDMDKFTPPTILT